jgi:hypothetical protein
MSPILQTLANSSAYGYRAFAEEPGDFHSIATATVGAGGANTITFSSIPQTYTHLQIRGIASFDFASDPGGGGGAPMRFNGDSGSNYTRHQLYGDGIGASAYGQASTTIAIMERFPYRLTNNSIYGAAICDILDYANTNKYKTIRNLGGYDLNGSGEMNINSAVWMSTSAITSIVIGDATNPLKQYSQFALYGIKG